MSPREYLQSICPLPLTLVWHQNLRSYLSFRKEKKGIYLRLHQLFERADRPVLDALIAYICQSDKAARAIVRKEAHDYFSRCRSPSAPLDTRGEVFDLQVLYDRLKGQFFDSSFDAAIGWSRAPARKRYRHITLGTYDRHRHRILIHPFLDRKGVPEYFIEFIVYHEMLHAVVPTHIDLAGRCRSHTRPFRLREQAFPHYRAAKEWEKQSLTFFKGNCDGRS